MIPSSPTISVPTVSLQAPPSNIVVSGGQVNELHARRVFQRNDHSTNNTTNNFINHGKGGLEVLQSQVCSAAFYNSAQRSDPPRCHPNTRESVLQIIVEWVDEATEMDRESWITWLSGAAGAGKTAIAQTVAELCVQRGIIVASFFFFRTDPTRNTIKPVVATLVYQIFRCISDTRSPILDAIANDPLIFEQAIEDQVQTLILNPLRLAGYTRHCTSESSLKPILFLIDGLDECNGHDNQAALLRALSSKFSANNDIPLRLFVASRPESHLSVTFSHANISRGLKRVVLNSDFLPDDDIRLFLADKFEEIKSTHPLRHHLMDAAWPSESEVHDIVEKSSGQFIYAAVVIKYISAPTAHPGQRLEVIRGLRPPKLDTPFAQLDALYIHIFSEVQDLKLTQTVLVLALWGIVNVQYAEIYLGMGRGSVELALAGLASIVGVSQGTIKFLHASLPDFLKNRHRSTQYYINDRGWAPELADLWFEAWKRGDRTYFFHLIDFLGDVEKPSSALQQNLLNFEFNGCWDPNWHTLAPKFLSVLKGMNLNDGGKAYKKQCAQVRELCQSKDHPLSQADLARIADKLHQHGIRLANPAESKNKFMSSILRRLSVWGSG
ncbi:hypothetical protein D9619_010173 [Psilocybe cf. subviscida]|uniref:NACHT domain-containing protein n=1 Tax=Psilocybe cf. subviscida TaxID=2480587 RepID=A0A8H5ASN6_9AGAR|nr:hypothetical protein D9619_010173 [Psilocybe cf. subviscida]